MLATLPSAPAHPTSPQPAPNQKVILPAGALDTRLDAADLSAVTALLAAEKIRHQTLHVGPTNMNHSITDHKRVFIKVARPNRNTANLAHEVAASTWAQRHGIRTTTPLLTAPVEFNDTHGHHRTATVWEWVEFCTAPALIDRVRDAINVALVIHDTPAPADTHDLTPTYWHRTLHERLAPLGNAPQAQLLRNLAATCAARIEDRWNARPVGWIHGDLHLGNLGWGLDGNVLTYDWESTKVGPIEVDVAQILRSIFVNPQDYSHTERVRVALSGADIVNQHHDIDWRLVKHLIHARAVSSMSLLILTGNQQDFNANQALLADPLDWLDEN